VEVKFDTGDVFSGRLVNFSLGGAFVQMETLPKFGSKVGLYINVPGISERCEIPCFVRWVNEGDGMGMQFEYTRPIEVWALTKLIKKLKQTE
jgi:Tfp pilus assembly protein PilZ